MKILICDDEYTNLEILKKHITEYTAAHCIKADIYATTSPKKIFENSTSYDLAFLDIQMPDIDGITIAKELKERNEKVVIFFVTAFDEYQDEAMDLHAFRFFEKPFDVQRLYASLDKVLQYIDKTYIDLFLYNGGEDKKILVDDIVYIRRENRKVILRTREGKEYVTRRDLNQWMEELPNTFFNSATGIENIAIPTPNHPIYVKVIIAEQSQDPFFPKACLAIRSRVSPVLHPIYPRIPVYTPRIALPISNAHINFVMFRPTPS